MEREISKLTIKIGERREPKQVSDQCQHTEKKLTASQMDQKQN